MKFLIKFKARVWTLRASLVRRDEQILKSEGFLYFPLVLPSDKIVDPSAETWPSGRRRSPAKGVYRRRYRGFESLPLRHFLDLTPVCVAYPRSGGRRAGSQPRPAASTGALSAAFRHIFSLQPEVRGAVSAAPLCATARRAACRLSQLRHDVSPLACRPCPGEDRPSDAGWRSRGRPGA